MKIDFKKSFAKDLKQRSNDRSLMSQLQEVILDVENATTLAEVKNLKKLKADGFYWRIKIGAYRVGLKVTDQTIVFVRFLHRREIYRYFPPK